MSSQFILEVIGALNLCSVLYMLFLQLSIFLVNPSVSMRLRPKRTCYRVVCFGGFHIQKQRISNIFLFLRGDFFHLRSWEILSPFFVFDSLFLIILFTFFQTNFLGFSWGFLEGFAETKKREFFFSFFHHDDGF